MKRFLFAVILVPIFITGDAFANKLSNLPRLAVLSLSQLPLNRVNTTSLLLLRRDTSPSRLAARKKSFMRRFGVSAALIVTAIGLDFIFDDHPGMFLSNYLPAIPGGIAVLLMWDTTEDAISMALANKNENNIVTYKHDRVGMLTNSDDKGLTIVDAQGNEEVLDPELEENLLRSVIIRDGLPSNSMQRIANFWSEAIIVDHAEHYRGATVAFTLNGTNHLGTITSVKLSAGQEQGQGQGKLVIATVAGDELHIISGKRGKPVVIDPNTGEESKDKFRGVVFVP